MYEEFEATNILVQVLQCIISTKKMRIGVEVAFGDRCPKILWAKKQTVKRCVAGREEAHTLPTVESGQAPRSEGSGRSEGRSQGGFPVGRGTESLSAELPLQPPLSPTSRAALPSPGKSAALMTRTADAETGRLRTTGVVRLRWGGLTEIPPKGHPSSPVPLVHRTQEPRLSGFLSGRQSSKSRAASRAGQVVGGPQDAGPGLSQNYLRLLTALPKCRTSQKAVLCLTLNTNGRSRTISPWGKSYI